MRFEVGVITITEREAYLKRTLASLKYPQIRIFKDKGDNTIPRKENIVKAHVAALTELCDSNPDYVILFQDDIVAAINCIEAAKFILETVNPPLLSLYSQMPKVSTRPWRGLIKIPTKEWWAMVAMCYKPIVIHEFKEWIEAERWRAQAPKKEWTHADSLFLYFLLDKGVKHVLHTSPSIVQHVGKESSIGMKWKYIYTREAKEWMGEHYDALRYYQRILRAPS